MEAESDTSTPDFKRGRHEGDNYGPEDDDVIKPQSHWGRIGQGEDMLTQKARREILKQGMIFKVPAWITHRRVHAHSILILADSQLAKWPDKDRICQVVLRDWPIRRWSQAIKTGEIRINSHTVVLYLEGTRIWQDVPPIKNALQSLCKVINNHSAEPRIFISNHLPKIQAVSPLQQPISQSNFTLQQATRSICHAIGKVFELAIFEHFVSSKQLKPAKVYFDESRTLSMWGCLIFRECVLHESGIINYWFAKGSTRKEQQ